MSNMSNMKFPEPRSLTEGFTDFSALSAVSCTDEETKKQIIERFAKVRDMSNVTAALAKLDVNPFGTNVRKRVAGYCNVNTDNEILFWQKSYLEQLRRYPDLQLIAMYCDYKNIPEEKRTGFAKLIQDAEAGKFDIIVVRGMKYISHDMKVCMQTISHLRNLPMPVGIFFITEYLYTLDSTREYVLQLLATVSEEFAKK